MNVVITGANKGLGFQLVKVLAENGHRVMAGVFEGDDPSPVERLAAAHAGQVQLTPLDVADEDSVRSAAATTPTVFSAVDVLINNAGVLLSGDRTATIDKISIPELRQTIAVNAIGTVMVLKYFLPLMRADGAGMMLFITSEAGSLSNSGSGFPAYSISKTAANKAVLIGRATAGASYRIYAMHPGRMNTDMGRTTAQIEPEEAAASIYRIAAGMTPIRDNGTGYIDYKGEAMPL